MAAQQNASKGTFARLPFELQAAILEFAMEKRSGEFQPRNDYRWPMLHADGFVYLTELFLLEPKPSFEPTTADRVGRWSTPVLGNLSGNIHINSPHPFEDRWKEMLDLMLVYTFARYTVLKEWSKAVAETIARAPASSRNNWTAGAALIDAEAVYWKARVDTAVENKMNNFTVWNIDFGGGDRGPKPRNRTKWYSSSPEA